MKKYFIVSLWITLLGGLVSAQDTVIAEYKFDVDGGAANLASTATEPNTIASNFGSGTGFTLNQGFGAIIGTTESQGLADGNDDNLADAITQNQYFTFTVNTAGVATVDLTSLSFNTGRWLNGAQDFYLFSSIGGFTNGNELLKVDNIAQSSSTTVADSGTVNFDFSTVVDPSIYEGLTNIEFRIYVDDRAGNSSAGSGIQLDNVIVTATVNSGLNASVSFNPLGADADVASADMNTVTEGGTWILNNSTLNAAGDGALFKAYSDDASDYFMVWDYATQNSTILDLSLTADLNFASEPIHLSWDMGMARNISPGNTMVVTGYAADDSTKVFEHTWNFNTDDVSGLTTAGVTSMGSINPAITRSPSITDMTRMGITLNGSALTYSAGNLSTITTLLNGETTLSRITFTKPGGNGIGFTLDNLIISNEPPANIISFTATPQIFDPGDVVTLSWEVSGADSVSIDNGIGVVASSGSVGLSPTGSTSFTLTAVRAGAVAANSTVTIQTTEDELFEGPEFDDAFTNPDDDPDLPNVLLIGDSISIGYTVQVRQSLAGKADVFRIPSNGKNSAHGVANIDNWLANTGPGQWDVIHFNWGLWDLAYRNPDSNNQGGRDKVNGTLTATPAEYLANMTQIVAKMKLTGATLIWGNTTPVPEGELGRFEGDSLIYNAAVQELMTTNEVITNDLHSEVISIVPSIHKAFGDVHFTDEGYVLLGKKVAQEIFKVLSTSAIESFKIDTQTGGAELALTWTAVPCVTYRVMTTTDLANGPWTEMSNGITGEGQVTVPIPIDPSEDKRFFRVISELE